MRRSVLCSLTFLIASAITGCGGPSKPSSPPARTFGAPTSKVKSDERYSTAYGCNGHPYYFDHEQDKWVYFDDQGQEHVSPLQPPCAGMRVRKVMAKPPVQKAAKTGA